MSPETPVKRKRGRPPKAGSLSNKITTTININVNTPASFHNTPTAEINSNLMIKRGAPDIMTPLMKVLPTPRRKKVRRENSTSSILLSGSPVNNRNVSSYTYLGNGVVNGGIAGGYVNYSRHEMPNSASFQGVNGIIMAAPGASNAAYGYQVSQSQYQYMTEEGLMGGSGSGSGSGAGSVIMMSAPTPMSMTGNNVVYTPQINPKTMDNMSMITLDSSAYYSTPPSLSAKGVVNSNYWVSTPPVYSEVVHNGQAQLNGAPDFSVASLNHDMNTPVNGFKSTDLLPPALIESKTKKSKRSTSTRGDKLKVLENYLPYSATTNILPTNRDIVDSRSHDSKTLAVVGSSDFALKLMVDDLGKAVLSEEMFNFDPKPVTSGNVTVDNNLHLSSKQTPQQSISDSTLGRDLHLLKRFHLDACIIAPTPASTVNSDDSILPATPKTRDNYLLASGHGNINGMTPNASNLTFNLTPQFNSMVHSMMNGNGSPIQQGRTHSVQLFELNSEPTFGHKNQLLKQSRQNHQDRQNGQHEPSQLEQGLGQRETINVSELMGFGSMNNNGHIGGLETSSHHFGLVPKSSTSTSGTSGLVSIEEFASGDNSADLSDARLALKRLVHIKRERD